MPFQLIYIDGRTVEFFPAAESWLVNSNCRRVSRMQGGGSVLEYLFHAFSTLTQWRQCRTKPSVKNLCFTSNIITFGLYWNSLEGNDLSNDDQIRVIGSMGLKHARKCSEIEVKNSEQNFPQLYLATPW